MEGTSYCQQPRALRGGAHTSGLASSDHGVSDFLQAKKVDSLELEHRPDPRSLSKTSDNH